MITTTLARLWIRSVRPVVPPDWPRGAVVFAIAHEDALLAGALFRRLPSMALVSLSRDGQILSDILSGGRMELVRGSSHRGALGATRRILLLLARGVPLVTALDGPKGPPLVPKPGPSWIASRAGVPVKRLRFGGSAWARARDWSRLKVPVPFSRPRAVLEEYAA